MALYGRLIIMRMRIAVAVAFSHAHLIGSR
jgi:hypothetical protein